MRQFRKPQKPELNQKLQNTNEELGQLNRVLAEQMIKLAKQTGDAEPLKAAVEALRSARTHYSFERCPREHAEIQQSIADTLLVHGKREMDRDSLEKAKLAYRGAITLASIIGDEVMREDLRANYKLTLTLLGHNKTVGSLFKVA